MQLLISCSQVLETEIAWRDISLTCLIRRPSLDFRRSQIPQRPRAILPSGGHDTTALSKGSYDRDVAVEGLQRLLGSASQLRRVEKAKLLVRTYDSDAGTESHHV